MAVKKTGAAILLAALLAAAGCATGGGAHTPRPFPRPGGWPADPPGGRFPYNPAAVTETALGLRGAPYVRGGVTPKGFDCSGFTRYVYAHHGVDLPRLAADQYRTGSPVDRDDLRPGDLVFFSTAAPGPSHVGMAIGDGSFIHAPRRRGVVRVERLDGRYWTRRYLGARRVGVGG